MDVQNIDLMTNLFLVTPRPANAPCDDFKTYPTPTTSVGVVGCWRRPHLAQCRLALLAGLYSAGAPAEDLEESSTVTSLQSFRLLWSSDCCSSTAPCCTIPREASRLVAEDPLGDGAAPTWQSRCGALALGQNRKVLHLQPWYRRVRDLMLLRGTTR